MAAEKRKPRKITTKAKECPACKGEGEVARTVRVGRRHREVGQQFGWCLTCNGSGIDPDQ
jgi:DnaJ-class molecular chaperone